MADSLAWSLAGGPLRALFLHSVQTRLAFQGKGYGGPPSSGGASTGSASQIQIQFQGALGTSLASGLLHSLSKARLLHQPFLPHVQGGKTGSVYALHSHCGSGTQPAPRKCCLSHPFQVRGTPSLSPFLEEESKAQRGLWLDEGTGCICPASHCAWHLARCLACTRYSGAIPGRREARSRGNCAAGGGPGLGSQARPECYPLLPSSPDLLSTYPAPGASLALQDPEIQPLQSCFCRAAAEVEAQGQGLAPNPVPPFTCCASEGSWTVTHTSRVGVHSPTVGPSSPRPDAQSRVHTRVPLDAQWMFAE